MVRSRRTLVVTLGAAFACVDAQKIPTAVSNPDPTTALANVASMDSTDQEACTGYGEPRIWLESQAWHHADGIDIPSRVGEQIQVGMCWPVNADGSEFLVGDDRLSVNARVVLRGATGPTSYIRVSDYSTVKVKKPLVIGPGDAEAWVPFDLDLSAWSSGRREFRWHANVPTTNDGARMYNSTSWYACLRTCSNVSGSQPFPFTQGKSYYEGEDDASVRFLSRLPITPVSGVWTFTVELRQSGSGGVFVDPDFPAGDAGVRLRGAGRYKGPVSVDTRSLTNGRHRLVLVSADGENAAAQVITFVVANGEPTPIAAVDVSIDARELAVGQATQASATVRDANGNVLTGRPVTWTTSDASVATVGTSGTVTGVAVGTATITAMSEGVSGSAVVNVHEPPTAPVASVSVEPATAVVDVGKTVQLTATPRDSNGASLSDRPVMWASSAPAIATVSGSGLVTGVIAGSVTITATSEETTGSAQITVQLPPPPPLPGSSSGIWSNAEDLAGLPTSGTAWDNVKRAADSDLTGGDLDVRDAHNVRTMAAGLVALRLDSDSYRVKVRESLRGLMASSISGSDPLAILRRLGTYAIAADLVDLKTFDPAFDQQFRSWLDAARKRSYDGETVAQYHERRPNNWGTHACISRLAPAVYLGDRAEVERVAFVFRGWLGDRTAYTGFTYGEDWWQADPSSPVGINPVGATKDGHTIDGVLPEEMRRSGSFEWPPPKENYVYTGLEGALGCAILLQRQGYDVWNWSDRALLRAFVWLHDQANYPAEGNDGWHPVIINKIYGTAFPVPSSITPGKNIGWGEWTHQR